MGVNTIKNHLTKREPLFGYKITLFVLFVCSMYPWFVWNLSLIYIYLFGAAFSIYYLVMNRIMFRFTKQNVAMSGALLLALSPSAFKSNINGAAGLLLLFITVVIVISLRDEMKIGVLRFITNGMAILLGVSLIFHLMFISGIPLPHTIINESDIGYGGRNYYVFVTNFYRDYYRFRSIFAEPGHLTMGLIPLIYANRLNIKRKSVLVLIIAELFTLSLAGYITLAIMLVYLSFRFNRKTRYARLLLFLSIIFVFINMVGVYSQSDNIISRAVISRLEYIETTGTIAGYNRTDYYTDDFFRNLLNSSSLWLGAGLDEYRLATVGSAGYKVFIIRNGAIGALFVIIFYFMVALQYRKYEVYGFYIVVMMLLVQNSYPFWFSVLFGYILGVSALYHDDSYKVNYKTLRETHLD